MIQRLSLALNLLASGIASRFYYINARIALGNLKVTQFYRRHTSNGVFPCKNPQAYQLKRAEIERDILKKAAAAYFGVHQEL